MNNQFQPSSSTDRAIASFQQTMQNVSGSAESHDAGVSRRARLAPGVSGSRVVQTEVEEHGETMRRRCVAPSRIRNGTDAVSRRNGHLEGRATSIASALPHESNGSNGKGKHMVAEPASPATAGPDRSTITTRLLETVRDRTGYPIETLGLDLDMEADLGIDSIKRVEILGKLRDEFPGLKALSDSPEMWMRWAAHALWA